MENLPALQSHTELWPPPLSEDGSKARQKAKSCVASEDADATARGEVFLPIKGVCAGLMDWSSASSRARVRGNEGKHSSRKDGRGQSKWGVSKDVMERYVDCEGWGGGWKKNLFVSPELGGQSKFPISSGVGEIGCPGKERAILAANGKCPCHSNQAR